MPSDVEKKIEALRNKIREHNYNYYVLTQPTVSDEQFDKLLKELEQLEKQYPELITSDSPTQRVGQDITNEFNPIQHKIPMLSLSNTYNEEELFDFDRRLRDAIGKDEKIE